MGKKSQPIGGTLGRTLVKDRFGKRNRPGNSMLHTTELSDGQDYNRINFQSITEQTHVDDFLSTAELAGTDFQAEKLNIQFVSKVSIAGIISYEERKKITQVQELNRSLLRIPRRPPWTRTMTSDELAADERESFLIWRRALTALQEVEGILLTPFEKNLEFWRQLWRVIERSDVIGQIVDARNPFLFMCEDLKKYVKEVDPLKENLLIVNKADFLTQTQRLTWAEYYKNNGIKFVFFSAIQAEEDSCTLLDPETKDDSSTLFNPETATDSSTLLDPETTADSTTLLDPETKADSSTLLNPETTADSSTLLDPETNSDSTTLLDPETKADSSKLLDPETKAGSCPLLDSPNILTRKGLIQVFSTMYDQKTVSGSRITIGLVGYPNVGKSSTINCLMEVKKVSVSETPGKTKNFQTLHLTNEVTLCDCPGLVFPGFVATKAEMIISGILPIDQMRDHIPPINMVSSLIPRVMFENIYGINIQPPQEGEDPNRPPTSEELLNCYGFMRGYMTQRGLPDNPRSARYILKDFMNGKLLYAYAPPGIDQNTFHQYQPLQNKKSGLCQITPQQMAAVPGLKRPEALDKAFFSAMSIGAHVKGKQKIGMNGEVSRSDGASSAGVPYKPSDGASSTGVPYKPWKKHNNKNKRVKSRILYADLDK